MKKLLRNLTLAGLVAPLAIQAQQSPQPPPPQSQLRPCSAAPAAPPVKLHFHIPPAIQAQINREKAKLSAQTGLDLPNVNPNIQIPVTPRPCQPVVIPPLQKPQ